MKHNFLGKTGLRVSRLSFGASSLGGVFHVVPEADAIRAVYAALDCGINYFDVAPAYGGTRAETLLGRALKGIPRSQYVISTKIGKYTSPGKYGKDSFDYSAVRIRQSLEESATRLGTDYFDIIHIHDIEYEGRRHTEWALQEGLATLHALKSEGRIGAVSFGTYPMDLWHRIFRDCDIDVALVHNHYCLNDTRLLELLPLAKERGVGLINASPFASALLTDRGPADWHPATPEDRAVFRRAAEYCRSRGTCISKLALQFASQHPEIPTTLFSSASSEAVQRNVLWSEEPFDAALVAQVRKLLGPVCNQDWDY
ncbi:MAG TPA: aldo/keto reductase [Verrucomicrobiae bacterium]|nr:aldo/keto reductase [Verrucomicrobiae bacterium]